MSSPVSAVDGSGNLASFSQRLDRVIAAPGVSIRSTVPDSLGNLNGSADDWANYSGTSMASPYVAGAAVLIRQAMAFAGRTTSRRTSIYQVMAHTADWVYDPATAQSYRKLNMQRALDYVMPADDYGSTVATAHSLGTIGASNSFTGTIRTHLRPRLFHVHRRRQPARSTSPPRSATTWRCSGRSSVRAAAITHNDNSSSRSSRRRPVLHHWCPHHGRRRHLFRQCNHRHRRDRAGHRRFPRGQRPARSAANNGTASSPRAAGR